MGPFNPSCSTATPARWSTRLRGAPLGSGFLVDPIERGDPLPSFYGSGLRVNTLIVKRARASFASFGVA
jgi:hypothetical protein